ncbi:neutrophil collagenase [Sarracenia purpurea var. burkii]
MDLKVFKLSLSIFLFVLLPLLSQAVSNVETSPFKFIKNLEGSYKGEKVTDLHQLKAYLEKFGYLNYQNSKNQANIPDDNFDDLLESAIKTYQQNYGLKVTGTLDAQTVSTMMAPQCGVADIINGTNWMQVGSNRHLLSRDVINSVCRYSFFPGNPRWPASKYSLTYSFKPGTRSDGVSATTRATNTWARSTQFTFTRTQSYLNSDLKISFEVGNHGDGNPFDGPGGVLAHAYAPTDGRLHLDGAESWATGTVRGSFDIETVVLHKLGHNLGLGHNSVFNAIMYPTISSGATSRVKHSHIDNIKINSQEEAISKTKRIKSRVE